MNAPKLRFEKFDEKWTSQHLEEITSYVDYRGKTPEKSDSGVFLVTAKNIRLGYIDYAASKEYIPSHTYDEVMRRGKPLIGDVLITTEAPLGNVASVDRDDIALAQRVIKLRGKANLIQNTYLKYCLLSEKVQKNILEKATGGTVKGIKGSVLHKIIIPYPTFPEQTKIANFLTAIDDKINQLTQKVELLSQYKKGVMQQIFSQKLRFKDDEGREFGEWREKLIGDVFDNVGGTALEEYVSSEGLYNFISIGNYQKTGHYWDNGQRIILNEKTKGKLLDKDNLVMVLNDKTTSGDLIGSTLLIPEDNKFIYNQRSERLVCRLDIIKPKFAWHFLNSFKFRKELFAISQGGTQIYVNFPAVKKLTIPIPSLEEQTKIANFLTSLDDQINHATAELDAVKQYKQGLLQQMFV